MYTPEEYFKYVCQDEVAASHIISLVCQLESAKDLINKIVDEIEKTERVTELETKLTEIIRTSDFERYYNG